MKAAVEMVRRELYRQMDVASAALKVFPRAANGLTPDAVKFSPEYRAAKAEFDRAFAAVRAFNGRYKRSR